MLYLCIPPLDVPRKLPRVHVRCEGRGGRKQSSSTPTVCMQAPAAGSWALDPTLCAAGCMSPLLRFWFSSPRWYDTPRRNSLCPNRFDPSFEVPVESIIQYCTVVQSSVFDFKGVSDERVEVDAIHTVLQWEWNNPATPHVRYSEQ